MGLDTGSLETVPIELVAETTEAAEDWRWTYSVIPVLDGVSTRQVAVFEDGSYTEWMPADALD
ncbi:hypothetical protein SEA_VROOMVROOM_41 [Arthrobacter phage VroomVroom]|uniref:Uncharacterized protein n=1 Tax=Arthrobacter phage VroomVroom TaxID=3049371 RepID=A0AA49FAE9_9CAUD|nr:hypothetical protein SEA_VROOMVROOM_41 [Arthrobacter phage VroomVroom]